jgi:hypothetical protein
MGCLMTVAQATYLNITKYVFSAMIVVSNVYFLYSLRKYNKNTRLFTDSATQQKKIVRSFGVLREKIDFFLNKTFHFDS